MGRLEIARIFVVLWLLFPNLGWSSSKTLLVVSGRSIPPFVVQENQSGIELEIVKEVFRGSGFLLNFMFVPYARVPQQLESAEADILLRMHEGHRLKAYLTDSYVTFENIVVTLKRRSLRIRGPEDLAGLRVIGFQNSPKVLGEPFQQAVGSFRRFHTTPDQIRQLKLLYLGRCDAIVLEKNIFESLKADLKADPKVQVFPEEKHFIFKKNHYKMATKSRELRDFINSRLIQLRGTGQIERILSKYLE